MKTKNQWKVTEKTKTEKQLCKHLVRNIQPGERFKVEQTFVHQIERFADEILS